MTEEFEEGEVVVVHDSGERDFPSRLHELVGVIVDDFKTKSTPYRYAVDFGDDFNYFHGSELKKFCQIHRCKPVYSTKEETWKCPFCTND